MVTKPFHAIEVDKSGVAFNWFTMCGKHMILDIKKDDVVEPHTNPSAVTCKRCLEKLGKIGQQT